MFTLDYIHHNPTSSQCKNPTLPPSVQKWDHMRGLNLPFEFYQEMQLYLHLQVDRTLRTALCIVVIWWTNTNNGKWIEQASLSPFLSLAVSRTFCKIIFSPMKVQSMRYVNLNHKESTIKMGLFMIKWRKSLFVWKAYLLEYRKYIIVQKPALSINHKRRPKKHFIVL